MKKIYTFIIAFSIFIVAYFIFIIVYNQKTGTIEIYENEIFETTETNKQNVDNYLIEKETLSNTIKEDLEKIMFVNSPEGLRVRNIPNLNGERIGLLNDLTEVKISREDENLLIIDDIEGKWVYIITDDIEGWVFNGYLIPYNISEIKNDFIRYCPNNITDIHWDNVQILLTLYCSTDSEKYTNVSEKYNNSKMLFLSNFLMMLISDSISNQIYFFKYDIEKIPENKNESILETGDYLTLQSIDSRFDAAGWMYRESRRHWFLDDISVHYSYHYYLPYSSIMEDGLLFDGSLFIKSK
jgi:hypothetical protein